MYMLYMILTVHEQVHVVIDLSSVIMYNVIFDPAACTSMMYMYMSYSYFTITRYEQLLREENIVLQEISAYERRIESWLTSKSDKTGSHVTSSVVKSVETTSMPSEVVAFEVILGASLHI